MNKIIEACLKTIVEYPKSILVVLALVFGFFATWIDDFQLDASSDSLLLEGDQDLSFYKDIKARYGDDEFLVVTYQPEKDLFAIETLSELKKLRDTKDTLVKLGIKGTTSDTLRVILNSFNLESWKQQTQQSFAKS